MLLLSRPLSLSSLFRSHQQPRTAATCMASQPVKAQGPGYGIFSCSGSPAAVEALSLSGLDWVCVDMQHGPLSYQDVSNLIRAVKIGSSMSIVRVGGPDDRFGIQQALDQGADGVMVPLVNTAEEARRAVSYCLFPPLGIRSAVYPSPAAMRGVKLHSEAPSPRLLSGYVKESNQRTKIWLQVETKESLANLDEILAVGNIDCLFLGPADLALSHGLMDKYGGLGEALASREMEDIVTTFLNKCKKHQQVKAGSFAFGREKARELAARGFEEIGFDVDLSILSSHCSQALDFIRA